LLRATLSKQKVAKLKDINLKINLYIGEIKFIFKFREKYIVANLQIKILPSCKDLLRVIELDESCGLIKISVNERELG